MTNNPIVPPQDQHDELFQRLIWTGSAANGASFLAISNIVANAPNQDSALAALAIPMFLLGSGLVIGGSAIWHLLYMRALRMSDAVYFRKSMNALDRAKLIKPAVAEMPMSLELAKIIHGDQAENAIRSLYKEIVAVHMKSQSEADDDFQLSQNKLKEINIDISKASEGARFWHNASLAFCAAGLIWALTQSHFGIHLNSPSVSALNVPPAVPISKQYPTPESSVQGIESKPKKIGPVP